MGFIRNQLESIVATFFLFTEHLDEVQAFCLCLDEKGDVNLPLALRPIEEIRTLQRNARTIVVLPAETTSLYQINLPWLGEHKAREAIPFALEEQLAQNVATLHFAFDREHYLNNHYLVAVIDKQFLKELMAKLDALNLNFDEITLDWFALCNHEACITKTGLLVHDDSFKGALSGELALLYLKDKEKEVDVLKFTDSFSTFKKVKTKSIDTTFPVWVAQRLMRVKRLNFCQGELRHDNRQQTSAYWYRASGIMVAVLLVSMVLFKGFQVHLLNQKIAIIDKKIATVYQEFFPGATRVISPKFRINQLLQTGATSPLWSLLNKLAAAITNGEFTIQQFRFQGKVLAVTLISQNFASLESLQSRLQKEQVNVTQAQASSQKNQVMATLELRL